MTHTTIHHYPPTTFDALRDHEHDYADALRAIGKLRDIDSPYAITMRLAYEDAATTARQRIAAIASEYNI